MAASAQTALLKREIEAKLASRIPAALSPVPLQRPRLMSSGVPAVDELLGGGIPFGGITELSGLESSGRTSLAFALLAEATPETACAYIDVDDTADPRSMAAAGVNLKNLLWVRLSSLQVAKEPEKAAAPGVLGIDTRVLAGQRCGGHHPRRETKGLDVALGRMLKDKAEARMLKMEGTPGHPNRKLSLADASSEQIRFEQMNARKADSEDPIRQADWRAAAEARQRFQPIPPGPKVVRGEKPWGRLDKALRAADQILQTGGFAVIVLDLASTPDEQALRIPSATWFRFRRAAQEGDAVFVLLTKAPCALSSASCVLDCTAERGHVGETVLGSLFHSAEVARQRVGSSFGKKSPGRAVGWEATPAWMRAGGR